MQSVSLLGVQVPHEVPADVRFGLWSCCRSVQPGAPGCMSEKTHWNFTQQCSQCALWFDHTQVSASLRVVLYVSAVSGRCTVRFAAITPTSLTSSLLVAANGAVVEGMGTSGRDMAIRKLLR